MHKGYILSQCKLKLFEEKVFLDFSYIINMKTFQK